MYVARHTETGAFYALPKASDSDRAISTVIDGEVGRGLTPDLRCADIHCDVPLIYRAGPKVSPHWAHKAGEDVDCEESREGGEGEWHRWMCRDVLARAHAHEYVVGNARADAVIKRVNSDNLTAIEVQYSPIKPATILKRHAEHQAGGLLATLWLVPGDGLIPHDADWATSGKGGERRIRTTWMIDLLRACIDTPMPYRCTVGFVVTSPGGTVGVRFVREVDLTTDPDGAEVAVIKKWTGRVGERTLREWAAGPYRQFADPRFEEPRKILDAASERRVKRWEYNPFRRAA